MAEGVRSPRHGHVFCCRWQSDLRPTGSGGRACSGWRFYAEIATAHRARTRLEVLLGCNDLSAELAEHYGYINRALPADELTPFVEKLAHRIASFPAHAIAHAKAAVDAGAFSSMAEGLLVEAHESDLSVASEVTQARVKEALKVGAETYEGELEMDYLSRLSPTR